jgi:hypothetical protein
MVQEKDSKNSLQRLNNKTYQFKRFKLQIFNFIDFLIKFLIQLKFSIFLLSGIE